MFESPNLTGGKMRRHHGGPAIRPAEVVAAARCSNDGEPGGAKSREER